MKTDDQIVNLSSFRPFSDRDMAVSIGPTLPRFPVTRPAAELYTAIYNDTLSRLSVSELTVEDPAEAFEDLRDRSDLRMLLAHEQFMQEGFGGSNLTSSHGGGRVIKGKSRVRTQAISGKGKGKMGPPVDKAWAEKWRKDLKIAGVRVRFFADIKYTLIYCNSDNSIDWWKC